jgi:hypothetical protein
MCWRSMSCFRRVRLRGGIPTLLLFSGSGMAAGGRLAGLLYDRFGLYEAAFLAGLIFNLPDLLLVGMLVVRWYQRPQAAWA